VAAPSREISGPGLTSLVAVLRATFQSTIDVLMHPRVVPTVEPEDQRQPHVLMAAVTRSSQTRAPNSFFGSLIKKA
jgi:hypothetical protein